MQFGPNTHYRADIGELRVEILITRNQVMAPCHAVIIVLSYEYKKKKKVPFLS